MYMYTTEVTSLEWDVSYEEWYYPFKIQRPIGRTVERWACVNYRIEGQSYQSLFWRFLGLTRSLSDLRLF